MHNLAELLASIPLPDADAGEEPPLLRLPSLDGKLMRGLGCAPELVHDLGADLPAGHLHVWGGPTGAGKTSFLLSLLHAAAARGRRVAYATYDLAPESLALRLLAMAADVELDALPDPGGAPEDCTLAPDALDRARASRASLSRLPFSFLAARGFSVESIRDRIVRMPFRAEVLAVDYLQGVIREPGTDMGVALRALSDLAVNLHVAVVCAVRPLDDRGDSAHASGADLVECAATEAGVSRAGVTQAGVADRVGWIAPVVRSEGAKQDARRSAEVVHNRHGERASVPLEVDEANGALERAPESS